MISLQKQFSFYMHVTVFLLLKPSLCMYNCIHIIWAEPEIFNEGPNYSSPIIQYIILGNFYYLYRKFIFKKSRPHQILLVLQKIFIHVSQYINMGIHLQNGDSSLCIYTSQIYLIFFESLA